jgi:hypothetical protein
MSHAVEVPVSGAAVGGLPGLEFAPGTNPSGDLSVADWRFLLPELRLDVALLIGVPPTPVLAALARTVGTIVVAASDTAAVRRVRDAARERGLGNVQPLLAAWPARLPLAPRSVGLVALCEPVAVARALAHPRSADELARLLAPGGTIYLELHRHADLLRARRWSARLAGHGLATPQAYWLLQRREGGIRLAAPVEAPEAVRYAFDHVLYGGSRRAVLLRQAGRWVSRIGLHRPLVPHRALVFHHRAAGDGHASPGPAHYLTELASRAGVELGPCQPAFFARGAYDSNKVAFFLFGPTAREPEIVVKMTRAPRYNHRLEAECHALTRLRRDGLADAGTYPEALFLGHHHDLAVLAQRVVRGSPFRTRTRGDTDCPFALAAVEWIETLGARSAVPAADAGELPRTLEELLARFERIHALSPMERGFLRERLHVLGTLPGGVPSVFQHGDAGTWNVLVTPDDRVAFLDWEVSSARGVPLWDLVDFLRSYGSWAARARGERDMVRAYAAHFVAPSPFSELQAEAVLRYRTRIGVPREAVEALFFSCWMHRAVREAAWSAQPPERGLYVNLVRRCIRQRSAEGLRWLFD